MPPETPTPPPPPPPDAFDWLAQHPIVVIWLGAFCLWVSASLILRLWFMHRKASILKKIWWSFILLIPFFGWLVYGGCFNRLGSIDTPCPREHDWASSGGGDGGFDGGGHH